MKGQPREVVILEADSLAESGGGRGGWCRNLGGGRRQRDRFGGEVGWEGGW